MGMRTVNNPYGDPSVLVDTVFGTSYDAVRDVANNIDYVKKVANLFDSSETIVSNIHQRYVSAEGQNEFELPVTVVSEAFVTVFVNGKWKSPSVTYLATNTTLYFDQALSQGDVVDVMIVSGETFDVLQQLKEDAEDSENKAQQSASLAQAWADEARQDRIQTGQDRVQTGLDRTAAGNAKQDAEDARDKAQDWAEGSGTPGGPGTKSSKTWAGEAETDRIQTGLYALATAADRVATGQDKSDAQTARTQAQTAQGLAEDAQGFAEAAQVAAEAAFRDFDKRYLGPYPAAPSLDLNGDPVVEGALYFDTVIETMRVYHGSGWVTIGIAGMLLTSANLSDVDSAATSRTNLGLGTAATKNHGTSAGQVPLNSDLGTMATEDAGDYVPQSDKASTLEAQAGEDNTKWMTPARTFDAIRELAIGEGQEWVDVTASRTSGTSYQNTTGRSIQVIIRINNPPNNVHYSTNGVNWIRMVNGDGFATAPMIIPPGHYYKATGILYWLELR